MKVYIGRYPGSRSKKERKISVSIHDWDTWDLFSTLSYVALPALRKFREELFGASLVDDEDVPEELRSTSAPPKKNEWDTDANHFKRWEWVLDEMIFAHAATVGEIEEPSFVSIPEGADPWESNEVEIGGEKLYQLTMRSWQVDEEKKAEWHKYHERVRNGFRLYGKYYASLWQ
nr:hypothetical protein [uncultured bacterium]AMP48400.1 hypothetical protein [uncultured bacterium]